MLNETRINLKHLLEDIRDSYPFPLEEIIITELVANALDSGASRIDFITEPQQKFIRCLDNGKGMKRAQLKNYHNVADTTKIRGAGIGFAGIGAKLSLLIADRVITESRGGHGSHTAAEWRLINPLRAPWKFIPFPGNIPHTRGTAITIFLNNSSPALLETSYIKQAIIKYFHPLFDEKMTSDLLRFIYRASVEFYINGERVIPPPEEVNEKQWFRVYLGKSRKLSGLGYLIHRDKPASIPGLAISTYGKIIKAGWEWLGITPREKEKINGVVEIPALTELLTTNKSDFLSDAAHLKKYYLYRKAIQEAVSPILKEWEGEGLGETPAPNKLIQPLNRQIDNALSALINDFPELSSLVGIKRQTLLTTKLMKETRGDQRRQAAAAKNRNGEKAEAGVQLATVNFQPTEQPESNGEQNSFGVKRIKKPGLKIILEAFGKEASNNIGRIVEDSVYVNTDHPAWQRAKEKKLEEYHVILAVSLTLSQFLEPQHSTQEFVERFLRAWGNQNSETARLL